MIGFKSKNQSHSIATWAAFWYSLRVLNIYSARDVCYGFWAL